MLFGGPVNNPVAERLANNGLKLNRFHTLTFVASALTGSANRVAETTTSGVLWI